MIINEAWLVKSWHTAQLKLNYFFLISNSYRDSQAWSQVVLVLEKEWVFYNANNNHGCDAVNFASLVIVAKAI